jgi:hypothetical protein
MLQVSVLVHIFQRVNQLTNFHENWDDSYANEGHRQNTDNVANARICMGAETLATAGAYFRIIAAKKIPSFAKIIFKY